MVQVAPEVRHPCESLPLAESHVLPVFLDGTDGPRLRSIQQYSRVQLFSSTPLFSLSQLCQSLMTALASHNFLAHFPTNVYFLYPRNFFFFSVFHNRRTCFCGHSCKKYSKYLLAPVQWLGFLELNIAHSSRSL